MAHPDANTNVGYGRYLGRAFARDGVIYMPGEGFLASSADDGKTWSHFDVDVEGMLYCVAQNPSGRFLAISDDCVLVSDGATWEIEYEGYESLRGVLYVSTRALIFGSTVLIREGGEYRQSDLAATGINAMTTSPSGTLFSVGESAEAFRSFDGGETWDELDVPGVDLNGVVTTWTGVLAVGCFGVMIHSVDEGETWERVEHPWGERHFWSIVRAEAPGTYLVGGDDALVARLTDPAADSLNNLD
ncbi:MAG: hypothetical protein AAGE52_37550 [Myxococcota bacterium]